LSGSQALAEIPAGRVLVTIDSQSDIGEDFGLLADFVQVPADVTVDDLNAALSADEGPSFFSDMVFAGGVFAKPGEQAPVVLELAPGPWFIINTDLVGFAALPLTVTGELPAEPVVVEALLTVHMTSYGFDLPESIASGEQIWEVSNTSPVMHHLILLKADQRYTFEEVMLALEQDNVGTAVEGAPDAPAIMEYGGVSLQTPGQTSFQVMNLDPGEYIVMCFRTDAIDSTEFHATQGVVDNFTVEYRDHVTVGSRFTTGSLVLRRHSKILIC